MIDRELLDMLVCPACKAPVDLRDPDPGDEAQARLVCSSCGLRYPVREDIPIMLIEEAAPAENDAGGKTRAADGNSESDRGNTV